MKYKEIIKTRGIAQFTNPTHAKKKRKKKKRCEIIASYPVGRNRHTI